MTPRPQGSGRRLAWTALLAAVLAVLAVAPASAVAASASAASTRYQRADRAVVGAATRLAACQRRHARSCRGLSTALQRAGRRLSRLQRQLGHNARSASLRGRLVAPALTLSSARLTWRPVAGVSSYILVRRVAGRADHFAAVTGTTARARTVRGRTVRYAVRTAVVGSAWSRVVALAASLRARRQAAPALTVSGGTLRWNQVSDVKDYVFVAKVPGRADAYSTVRATTLTPPAVPGATVRYSVRTDVDGSHWAPEVSITYAADEHVTTTTPAPAPAAPSMPTSGDGGASRPASSPAPSPAPVDAGRGLSVGVNTGSAVQWELPFVQTLGAHRARMEFDISTPVSQMEPVIAAYAAAGIQPLLLAGFQGRMPTVAEADNLASWAAAFGPGGTFRQGKGWAESTAVTHIEFGNESNQSWQYPVLSGDPNWAKTSTYRDLATQYALRFKDAVVAIRGANANVGLLAIGDTPGNWPQWLDAVFAAVPSFGSYVAGWTIHPYGPQSRWQPAIDNALTQLRGHGASDAIPLYLTEYGIASDDGRCLSDNYGWDTCMSYGAAADALNQAVSGMAARYGSRVAEIYLYQARDQKASGQSSDREAYFGALHSDQSPKGAYTTAVRTLLEAA